MFKNVSFFVTIKNDDNEIEIKRLKIDRKAQIKLTPLFIEASEELLKLERVPFQGSYKPDENEVQLISNFQISDEVISAIKNPLSVEYLNFQAKELPQIISVFTGTVDPLIIAFQRFHFSQFITNKGISIFNSNDTFHLIDGFGLNFQSRVDSFYTNQNLLFKSFHTARQIFDLSQYYREATDSDITDFMSYKSVYIEDKDLFYAHSDSWVRNKIALIKDTRTLEKFSASQICEKAASYGLSLKKKKVGKSEKIVFPDDKKEMKLILRFLDEEIYKGPLSDTTYLTNSKRKYN